jgi:hypothetical protein
MWHAWGKENLYTWFWWRNLSERILLEDAGIDERIILKWIFKKSVWMTWMWLRLGTSGGLL